MTAIQFRTVVCNKLKETRVAQVAEFRLQRKPEAARTTNPRSQSDHCDVDFAAHAGESAKSSALFADSRSRGTWQRAGSAVRFIQSFASHFPAH